MKEAYYDETRIIPAKGIDILDLDSLNKEVMIENELYKIKCTNYINIINESDAEIFIRRIDKGIHLEETKLVPNEFKKFEKSSQFKIRGEAGSSYIATQFELTRII